MIDQAANEPGERRETDEASAPPTPAAPNRSAARSAMRELIDVVGLLPPRHGDDPYAHRRGEPRGFAVLWLAFMLLASAAVYTSIGSPVFTSPQGYRFASLVLMTVIAAGCTTLWPMIRLCQSVPRTGIVGGTVKDLVIVLVPVQAFYWPQVLLTGWGIDAIAAGSLVIAAWAAGTAAMIAGAYGVAARRIGHDLRATERAVWMLAAAAAPLIAPMLLFSVPTASDGSADAAVIIGMASPYSAPWEVFADRVWTGSRTVITPLHWRMVGLNWAVCAALWGVVLLARHRPALARHADRA